MGDLPFFIHPVDHPVASFENDSFPGFGQETCPDDPTGASTNRDGQFPFLSHTRLGFGDSK